MNKITLVFVGRHKYGDNTDFYEFEKNIDKEVFNVEYICIGVRDGYKLKDNITTINGYDKHRDGLSYGIKVRQYLKSKYKNKNAIIFVKHFYGCFILGSFLQHKTVIDIRTVSISKRMNRIKDMLITFDTLLYNYRTAISEGVGKKIFRGRKFEIIPLGAPSSLLNIKTAHRDNKHVNFIYIGTFDFRDIDILIHGYAKAKKNYSSKLSIIGFGMNEFEKVVKTTAEKYDNVDYIGFVPYESLEDYLSLAHIGISYIPITDRYDNQPPTKTYEYLMSGIPVLGTSTTENKRIITSKNGWLIQDNENEIRAFFESISIPDLPVPNICRESVMSYAWEEITSSKLEPIFKAVYKEM